MKKLFLIRHAKASWDELGLADFDRPLTETGQNDAHQMAEELKSQYIQKPDLFLSSPAKRAITTAEIMADIFKYPRQKISSSMRIYNGGVEDLVSLLQEIPSKINSVLLFGHNPNLTWLLHYLCEECKINIPTCGIVGLSIDAKNWVDICESDTKMIVFLHPHHETQPG